MGLLNQDLGLEDDFSLSVWIRSQEGENPFNYNPIFYIGDCAGSNGASQLEVYVGNGGLTVATNRKSLDYSFDYFDNFDYSGWTQLGLSLNGDVLTVYIDGNFFDDALFNGLNSATFGAFLGSFNFRILNAPPTTSAETWTTLRFGTERSRI